jgi:hypothetical protein
MRFLLLFDIYQADICKIVKTISHKVCTLPFNSDKYKIYYRSILMTTDNLENLSESGFTDAAASRIISKIATLEIMSINKAPLFSTDECNQILSTCIEELWLPATVIGGGEFHQSKRQK